VVAMVRYDAPMWSMRFHKPPLHSATATAIVEPPDAPTPQATNNGFHPNLPRARPNVRGNCAQHNSHLPCARVITNPRHHHPPLHSCGTASAAMERNRKRTSRLASRGNMLTGHRRAS
jgi:hypothetical protein